MRLRRLEGGGSSLCLPRVWRGIHSLHTRLFISFALLVLLALVMAAAVFVTLRRGQSDRETLDRLAAAAPEISLELRVLHERGASPQQVDDYLHQVSRDRGVRVLLVDRRDGSVVNDSGGGLRGKRLNLPTQTRESSEDSYRVIYRSWRGSGPETGNLTFLTAAYGRVGKPFPRQPTLGANPAGEDAPFLLRPKVGLISPSDLGTNEIAVLAVPAATGANAWLRLLPGLAWAGLVALALSALMAELLARSIVRPVVALTRASEEMTRGNFDQEVAPERPDEIKRLAAAFNRMAREVGHSHLHTRALIANVSHDLRTPLTSILGFAQALRDGTVEEREEVHELSGIIHEEATHIYDMVEDLLYLSQIEAGEVILTRSEVNLADLAQRCLRRIEPAMRERDITICAELESGVVAHGDAGKLERVLDNLLDNARKYTPAGGKVELIVRGRPDSVGTACIRVRNSGSYIPHDELPRVFDRFYRMDRSRGSTIRGTGLGLAIVKDLVDLHRGTIEARSDLEHGTVFEVVLPAPRVRLPDPSASALDHGPSTEAGRVRGHRSMARQEEMGTAS